MTLASSPRSTVTGKTSTERHEQAQRDRRVPRQPSRSRPGPQKSQSDAEERSQQHEVREVAQVDDVRSRPADESELDEQHQRAGQHQPGAHRQWRVPRVIAHRGLGRTLLRAGCHARQANFSSTVVARVASQPAGSRLAETKCTRSPGSTNAGGSRWSSHIHQRRSDELPAPRRGPWVDAGELTGDADSARRYGAARLGAPRDMKDVRADR